MTIRDVSQIEDSFNDAQVQLKNARARCTRARNVYLDLRRKHAPEDDCIRARMDWEDAARTLRNAELCKSLIIHSAPGYEILSK